MEWVGYYFLLLFTVCVIGGGANELGPRHSSARGFFFLVGWIAMICVVLFLWSDQGKPAM